MRPLKKRHFFTIPTTSKFVFGVILIAACVSIGRLQPIFDGLGGSKNDFTTIRTLRESSSSVQKENHRRVVFLDCTAERAATAAVQVRPRPPRSIAIDYPLPVRLVPNATMDHTTSRAAMDDWTRFYPEGDSNDFPTMERRLWPKHEFDPHCIPMAKWQSEFYPVCNDIHANANLREAILSGQLSLLSNKGFWRHAWRFTSQPTKTLVDNVTASAPPPTPEVTVWKTFK
jgi:hypothetical protein